jgi:hypothetical protein
VQVAQELQPAHPLEVNKVLTQCLELSLQSAVVLVEVLQRQVVLEVVLGLA